MKGFREQGVLVKPARRDNKRLAMLTHLLCTRHNFSSDVRHTPLQVFVVERESTRRASVACITSQQVVHLHL